MTRLTAAILVFSLLAACGGLRDSRMNPANWFGRDKEERIAVEEAQEIYVDPKGLVSQIVSLKVDRMPGGAIINAFGLPPTQGYWSAELKPVNGEIPDKGTLIYEFRLLNPTDPQLTGTQRSREVVVGHFVSDQTLLGVRRIEVRAATNKRTVRR